MPFYGVGRRIFDNGIREQGGVPQARPAWVTNPSAYPITSLPWGAFLDARDNAAIVLDGGGDVQAWASTVPSPERVLGAPYVFRTFGPGLGSNPSLNVGTALPSGAQFVSFNGTTQSLRSGVHNDEIRTDGWDITWYSDTFGLTGNHGLWLNPSFRPAYDATTLTLTGLWRPEGFSVPPTWSGTASGGNSGAHDLSDNSGTIGVGTFVNGYPTLDFLNGFSPYFLGQVMSTYLSAAAWSVVFLFKARTAVADPGPGLRYQGPCIIGDGGSNLVVAFTTSGISVEVADGVGAASTLTYPASVGVWNLVRIWYDGTDIHLQVNGDTPVTETYGNVGSLSGQLIIGSNSFQSEFFDGELLEVILSNLNQSVNMAGIGRYLQNRYGLDLGCPNAFYQLTPSATPGYVGGARADGVDDYLDSDLILENVFGAGGADGTFTFAWYGDSASAPSLGTNVAQTPYNNPAILSDVGGYFTIAFTTAGITFGIYDNIPRDSGGGPASNDGWQMATAPLSPLMDAVVQVRWGLGKLEVRVITATDFGVWHTADCGSVFGYTYKLRMFADYSATLFAAGIVYTTSAQNRRLSDAEADDAVRTVAARVGIVTPQIVAPLDAYIPLGPDPGGNTPGYTVFTVVRANSRAVTSSGYAAPGFWATSFYWMGLGSTSQGGVAQLSPWSFDAVGSSPYDVNVPAVNDSWHLLTTEYKAQELSTRLDGIDANLSAVPASLITSGVAPTAGTAVNGFTPATFNGTTQALVTDLTAGSYISPTAYTSITLVYIPTAAAPSGNPHTDPGIWVEGGVNCGLTFSTSGAAAIVYDGTQKSVTKACTTGAYHLIVTRLDGSTLSIRIDGSEGTPVACGPVSGIPSAISIGASGVLFQSARVLAQVFTPSALSDGQVDGVGRFLQTKFALSLGFTASALDPTTIANATSWIASFTASPWLGTKNLPTKQKLASDPMTSSQYVYLGYGPGGGLVEGGMAFWGAAPTKGWSESRIRDVEAYLDKEFLQATGVVYNTVIGPDNAAVTDSLARTVDYGRVVADAAVVTESLTKASAFGRVLSDTLVVTETLARSATYGKVPSDTVAVTDAVVRGVEYGRSLAEGGGSPSTIYTVTGVPSLPAGGTWPETIMNTGRWGFSFTPTLASTDGSYAGSFIALFANGPGALWIVDRALTLYNDSAVAVFSQAMTWSAGQTVRLVLDIPAQTITISGASTGNGTFSFISSGAYYFASGTLGVGVYSTGGFNFSGSISNIDDANVAGGMVITDSISVGYEHVRVLSDTVAITDALTKNVQYERAVTDTASLTDAAVRNAEYGRALTDNAVVTDSVTLTVERAQTDSISVTDSAKISVEYARFLNDTATITDSVSGTNERALSDTITVTDSVARSVEYGRSAADTASVTDSVLTGFEYARALNDTLVVTDSTSLTNERSPGDTVTVTDSAVSEVAYARAFADFATVADSIVVEISSAALDSISITDSVSLAMEYGRAVSDTASVTDSITVNAEYGRSVSDNAGVSDTTVVSFEFARNGSDTVTVADTAATSTVYARSGADTATLTDALVRNVEFLRTLSDTVSVTDTSSSSDQDIQISDAISVTDAVAPSVEYLRTLSDTLSITDSTAPEQGRSPSDTVSVSDSVTRNIDFLRALSDVAAVTDTTSVAVDVSRAFADTMSLSDNLSVSVEYSRTQNDSIVITDDTSFQQSTDVVVSDTLAITDSIVLGSSYLRATNDTLSITDVATSESVYQRAGTDTVSTTDSVQIGFSRELFLSDTASISDSIKLNVEYQRALSDTASVTDDLSNTVTGLIQIVLSDSISMTDSATRSADYGIKASDVISTTDSAAASRAIGVTVSDTLSISDTVARALDYSRTLSDDAVVTDEVVPQPYRILHVSISDAVTITDLGTRSLDFSVSLTDNAAISDAVIREMAYARELHDIAALDDSITISRDLLLALDDILVLDDSIRIDFGGRKDLVLAVLAQAGVSARIAGRVFFSSTIHASSVLAALVRSDKQPRVTPASLPNNGLSVVPSPTGPAPVGLYEYIIVMPQAVVPPNAPMTATSGGSYQSIETELTIRNVRADRISLINGIRIYRLQVRDLWRLESDRIGPFVSQGPVIRYRTVTADPTVGQPAATEWRPI